MLKPLGDFPFRASIIMNNKKYKIINNSKSTNLHSTISSLKGYNNIHLILGGIAKDKKFIFYQNIKNSLIVFIFLESLDYLLKKIK